MPAPPPDVADRLERLAALAPVGSGDPEALWQRGRRRQRARTAAAVAAVAVVGVLGAGVAPVLVERSQEIQPADPDSAMVLPDVIRQPNRWDSSFPKAPGRLSAVGTGTRSSLWPLGSTESAWGVSASTGESGFLDLPDAADLLRPPALSADGSKVAYWVTNKTDGLTGSEGRSVTLAGGVAVLDLETGEVETWEVDSPHGLWISGLAWAGDVLWWSAGEAFQEESGAIRAAGEVHTWDLRTGRRDDWADGPRSEVVANGVGDAPNGFVEVAPRWRLSRIDGGAEPTVLRMQPPVGAPARAGLTSPAMSPDGAVVAGLMLPDASRYDDAAKVLLVGSVDGRDIALRQVGDLEEQGVAGWRSPDEVVVTSQADVEEGRPARALHAWTVDVTTGQRTGLLAFEGDTPQVAADAWSAEVVPAPEGLVASISGMAGSAAVVLGLVLLAGWGARGRRSRRGHP